MNKNIGKDCKHKCNSCYNYVECKKGFKDNPLGFLSSIINENSLTEGEIYNFISASIEDEKDNENQWFRKARNVEVDTNSIYYMNWRKIKYHCRTNKVKCCDAWLLFDNFYLFCIENNIHRKIKIKKDTVLVDKNSIEIV